MRREELNSEKNALEWVDDFWRPRDRGEKIISCLETKTGNEVS